MTSVSPHGPKSGWHLQAELICSGAIATTADDVPALLEWLRDLNWPGAPLIAEYLVSFGDELVRPLQLVLGGDDLIWKRWVLVAFGERLNADLWSHLAGDLERIANDLDDREGANVEALYILARTQLRPRDWLRLRVASIASTGYFGPGDFLEIEP